VLTAALRGALSQASTHPTSHPKIYSQRSGMNRALYAHKTALRLKQHLDHMSLRESLFTPSNDSHEDSSWLQVSETGAPMSPDELASHPDNHHDGSSHGCVLSPAPRTHHAVSRASTCAASEALVEG
jgi:hypothetical protein